MEINIHCLDYSDKNILVILLETSVFLAPVTRRQEVSVSNCTFLYNHDILVGTIQTVYVYLPITVNSSS